MERLTERTPSGSTDLREIILHSALDGATNAESRAVTAAIDRLADYEDTGLTPYEIELYKEAQDWCETSSPARVAEIIRAEKDGRLVVLPEGETREALKGELATLNMVYGGAEETYTAGYRNGHRNGVIETLSRILGIHDGCQEAEAALREEAEHG